MVNRVVFFVKNNENTYPKGRALMQMYRIVPITKRGNGNAHLTMLISNTHYKVDAQN